MKTNLESHSEKRIYCRNCTKVYRECENKWGNWGILYSDNPIWLKVRVGPYGKFAGCPNFPACKYSISLEPKVTLWDYDDELRPY